MSKETTSQTPDASEILYPLIPGTILLDRYTIVELASSDATENVYWVFAAHPCPVCGVENEGGQTECGFCGSPLPAPARLRLAEKRAPADVKDLPPTSFVMDDCCYTFVETETPAHPSVAALRFSFGIQTDAGLKRGAAGNPNEDSVAAFVLDAHHEFGQALGLFVVADGVGGVAAGEIASRTAVQTFVRECAGRILLPAWNGDTLADENIRAALTESVQQANARLLEYQTAHAVQIATTLTAALVLNGEAYIVNVGDSRTYLWRAGQCVPLTRDHSYVAMLVANGVLTAEEVYEHPQRNLILRSLGEPQAEADIFPQAAGTFALQPDDQLLLCSDGLWEMVRDAEIAHVLETARDPQAACAQLVVLANQAGGADNISVLVIQFDKTAR